MFYVLNPIGQQVDESPFSTREDAQAWIDAHPLRCAAELATNYRILTEAEMDAIDV